MDSRTGALAALIGIWFGQDPWRVNLTELHPRCVDIVPLHVAGDFMISLEDCVALSGLTEAQVLAIAEHEPLAAKLFGQARSGARPNAQRRIITVRCERRCFVLPKVSWSATVLGD
jgi:hypothetical protein